MSRHDEIKASYKTLGNTGTFYDGMITRLDYSADMMKNAKKRADAMGIRNVSFVQGDVGALPFPDESFDIVLSLNGFHVFPDKDVAFWETHVHAVKAEGIFYCVK